MDSHLSEVALNNVLRALKERPVEDENQDNFISEAQARAYAGNICPATMLHWRQRGLVSFKVDGRRLYRKKDLDAYIFGGNLIRRHHKNNH